MVADHMREKALSADHKVLLTFQGSFLHYGDATGSECD